MRIGLLLVGPIFVWLQSGCQGRFCPVSLPQNVQWFCKHARRIGLLKRQKEYGIEEPSKSMPFARLKNGLLSLTLLLIKDPFLKSHADKWRFLSIFNNLANTKYMSKNANAPAIMTKKEFLHMAEYFKRLPPNFLVGKYVKIPSDKEPFQKTKEGWISDQHFAEQRLAGTNPFGLKKITFSDKVGINWSELKSKINDKFEWDNITSQALNGMSMNKAIKDGLLYVLYHPNADDLLTMRDKGDNDPKRKMWKFMSPIAVFASVPTKGSSSEVKLMPVAIQMDHEKDSPVYTPKDGDLWTLAKLNVQLTDFEVSQITEHLSKVHLVSEGLCLSIERQFSYQHPFHVIMRYHCRGVITTNTYGEPVLLADKNRVDFLFPYGYKGANKLVASAAKMFDWSDIKLENNMKNRGLEDKTRLPYYPFRDDGAEIVKAIRNMLTDYVNEYYFDDYEVESDEELQNFASEVSDAGSESKVMLRGFPDYIDTKELLVDTFTQMIWLMTGHHASINYPMLDYAAYVPNMPLKLYDSKRVSNITYDSERLPNRKESASQVAFTVNLAAFRQDRLFDYGPHLRDAKGKHVVSHHYRHLRDVVDPLLEKRNLDRLRAGHLTYPYMQPKWIPNGIQT